MKVKELIRRLQQVPEEAEVYLTLTNGFLELDSGEIKLGAGTNNYRVEHSGFQLIQYAGLDKEAVFKIISTTQPLEEYMPPEQAYTVLSNPEIIEIV